MGFSVAGFWWGVARGRDIRDQISAIRRQEKITRRDGRKLRYAVERGPRPRHRLRAWGTRRRNRVDYLLCCHMRGAPRL